MLCPEFEKYGLLFISGELDGPEKESYTAHQVDCEICRLSLGEYNSTVFNLKSTEAHRPSESLKKTILTAAAKKRVRKRPTEYVADFVKNLSPLAGSNWKFAAGFATAILLMLLTRPLWNSSGTPEGNIPDWDDAFISNAVWLDQEMDRLESGNYLGIDQHLEIEHENFENFFNEELDSLESEIRKLSDDLYGI